VGPGGRGRAGAPPPSPPPPAAAGARGAGGAAPRPAGPARHPTVLSAGPLRLDTTARTATRDGDHLHLTPKQLALLEILLRRQGEVLTGAELLEQAWDRSFEGASNVVAVHIRRLRDTAGLRDGPVRIETVRGHGYRLAVGDR
jgi:two-component system, OmpR family, response regulator